MKINFFNYVKSFFHKNDNKIKVWDYIEEYESEKTEIFSSIKEVLDSGWLILGQKVKSFEQEYSKYCNVKFGIGVANGTDAIFLALKALGIGKGDEVITVSNTAIPTVSAIVSAGAKPVFVDINENTYLMDVSKIEDKISNQTKCILPVHLYGQCVEMDELNRIAKKYNLFVLEDCAQSHGAIQNNNMAGSMSDISTTSFYPTKILGTYGDGGMVNTNCKILDKKMRMLRFYGAEKTYYAKEHGYNSRLDELHASILLKKLNNLDYYLLKRKQIAKIYNCELNNTELILPTVADNNIHSYYVYVVRHAKRDKIMSELKKYNIYTNISYPWPIHLMTGYSYLGYEEGSLPVTENMANQIFSLPMYPTLSKTSQKKVIDTLRKILDNL
tara:strand:+ start:7105 stop:8262 length:1158 start_codon:yes stop_codon:yes gene_type:complete